MQLDYHIMRTFADSWGLLFMVLYFLAVLLWVLRPQARALHDDAADIPFRED